ncbi:MAG: 7-carboxy-7-deazaguanine synthase QueE [Paludibacteraceae bacterium]|nr:7-carboxy-7-deazaguanine synthase QueE [Paludibacteraceae bacterium]
MKRINEIFMSLQGEGFHTGTSAVFVRFSGCNLKCPFCDTKHETFVEMSEEEIEKSVSGFASPWVILTGGEPSLQATESLVERLHNIGKKVAMETNGTHEVPHNLDWVTLSPKEGKAPILSTANEVKVVFTESTDVEHWHKQIKADHYFLQPCSCQNTKETVAYILEHPHWRLSLQTHKYIGIE